MLAVKVSVQAQSVHWAGEESVKAPERVRAAGGEDAVPLVWVTEMMVGEVQREVMLVVISKLPDESEKLVRPVEAEMRG